jgi:hypothetical protein
MRLLQFSLVEGYDHRATTPLNLNVKCLIFPTEFYKFYRNVY